MTMEAGACCGCVLDPDGDLWCIADKEPTESHRTVVKYSTRGPPEVVYDDTRHTLKVKALVTGIRPVKGVGSGARIPVAPIGMAWQRAQGRDDGARVAPARDGSRSCLRTGATAALAHHAKAAHQGTHGGPVPFALSSRPARPARPSTRRA